MMASIFSFLSDPMNYVAIVAFITIITLLVAAHEYGHYLFARIFNMEVEEFAIGFGKKPLFTWLKRGDTVFTVRPWPVGGFVRIKAMEPQEDGSETQVNGGFYSKGPFKRFIVLLAGPVFSILAGWLVLVPLFAISGKSEISHEPVLGFVSKDTPAFAAGLKEGDRILTIDGKPIAEFVEMTRVVEDSIEKPLRFEVKRDKKTFFATVIPVKSADRQARFAYDGERNGERDFRGRIGVLPTDRHVPMSLSEAFNEAFYLPVRMLGGLGKIVAQPVRFKEDMGGPITMVAYAKSAATSGFENLLRLAGLLSISLGIFNLLPVPPLDGGQMLFCVAEMFRRGRRLSLKTQSTIAAIGLALVCLLMVSVFVVDIRRFFAPPPPLKASPQSQSVTTPDPKPESTKAP